MMDWLHDPERMVDINEMIFEAIYYALGDVDERTSNALRKAMWNAIKIAVNGISLE